MAPRLELDRRTLRLMAIAFALLAVLSIHRMFFAEPEAAPDILILAGRTMGTSYEIRLAGEGLDDALRERVEAETTRRLDQVDRWMSDWNPDSEVSRFNEHADTSDFPVSRQLAELVSFALELNTVTDGAFDVSVGPLVALWGFGSGARVDAAPSEAGISALRRHTGPGVLRAEIDEDSGSGLLGKNDPATRIDLSAIAKGYGVDHVAAGLEALGRNDYLVEIGGEVRARGERPGGGPWRVAVEKPLDEGRRVQSVVELENQAMATSGDYRIFYEEAGKRYSHTIDPRTGRPVEGGPASASVLADTATAADAWATALMVLGEEDGLALADERGIAALLLSRDEDGSIVEHRSRAWPR